MRDTVLLNAILMHSRRGKCNVDRGCHCIANSFTVQQQRGQMQQHMLSSGWVGVVQDARGRFGSGGNFTFWRTAATDGEDRSRRLAAQPWSNGKFATTGSE